MIIRNFAQVNTQGLTFKVKRKFSYGYNKIIAVLFDFDGVIMDTESQYTVFGTSKGISTWGKKTSAAVLKGKH